MYDLLIIGGGCAGSSAAITARQRNLNVLMLYAGDGALEKAARVDNYPGLPQVSGGEMVRLFRQQAQDMGTEIKRQLVQKVLPLDDSFSVLAGMDLYEARTILLALGTSRVNPLQGEEELLGQGVSYCATCDGMFYKDKHMIVVAGGLEAVEEANYLSEIGKVSYFTEKPHDKAELSGAIEQVAGKPKAIEQAGAGMRLITDQGSLEADGIFVLRPAVAMTQLLPEVAVQKGAVVTDENLMTNLPGVFAAGDIIGAPLQAAKAVGDGNRAALAIASYLRKQAAQAEKG